MPANRSEIAVPFPDATELRLRIVLGPCRLRVRPGSPQSWASGTYDDPTGLLPLNVTSDGSHATLSQSTTMSAPSKVTAAPVMELQLGTARPYELTFEGGANETLADLGAVPLTRLTMRHGAGKSEIDFSAPNPASMASLDVAAGGVALDMRNLANANFAQMTVAGGAAQYRLDFGGRLQRDGEVRLNTGVAAIELLVPRATPARIRTESILGGLDVGDGFMTREGAYWNEAALAGGSPSLQIMVTSVFGSVKIRST